MRRALAPVIGDLIEEYREVVRPSRGRLNAAVWFVTQIASLLQPWMWGLILGVTLGGLNLVQPPWRL